jgi:hypothetical protein
MRCGNRLNWRDDPAALSPLIAIGLMTAYKPATWPISVYMIALALITIVSVYFASHLATIRIVGPLLFRS